MKLFSELSGQIACEIGQRQNLCFITFVYYFSRFVSAWPASEVVDGPIELCSALNKFWFRQKMQSHLVFGHNDRFFFMTPEKNGLTSIAIRPLIKLKLQTSKVLPSVIGFG